MKISQAPPIRSLPATAARRPRARSGRRRRACPSCAAILVARVAVARPPPRDRARDPAAVEREGRDQVEDEEQQVDATSDRRAPPAGRPRGPTARTASPPRSRSRLPRATPISRAQAGDQQRHDRPGDGDPELDAGRVGVALHLRDPAEQPQVDAEIAIRLRIATRAWPSSCSRIERKKSSALAVASAKAPASLLPGIASW